jgi:very-short-patch-repair endonuclease
VRGFARQMRHEPSLAEAKLWRELKSRRFGGWKFRRQHVAGAYILDFYCAAARLAVELDGGQHGEDAGRAHDAARTLALERAGVRVLRFWNDLVLQQTSDVLEQIEMALLKTPSPRPSPPDGGEGVARRAIDA